MNHYQLPMLHNPESIRKFNDFFECQRCGQCCRYDLVDMFAEDVRRIERYGLPREYIVQFMKFVGEKAYLVTTGGCPFLNEKNECEIYEARPDTCHRYPIQYPRDGRIVVREGCQAVKNALHQLQEWEGWPVVNQDSASPRNQNTGATADSLPG